MTTQLELTLPQVADRWGISKSGVKVRAKLLGVKLNQISSTCSVWPAEYLDLGDQYHRHIQAGGTKATWAGPLAPAAGTAATPTTAEPPADPLLRPRLLKAMEKEEIWLPGHVLAPILGLKRMRKALHNKRREGFRLWQQDQLWTCWQETPELPSSRQLLPE